MNETDEFNCPLDIEPGSREILTMIETFHILAKFLYFTLWMTIFFLSSGTDVTIILRNYAPRDYFRFVCWLAQRVLFVCSANSWYELVCVCRTVLSSLKIFLLVIMTFLKPLRTPNYYYYYSEKKLKLVIKFNRKITIFYFGGKFEISLSFF